MGSSSVAAPAKLEVRPIAGSLGAEVIGLDFSAVSAVADELRKALNEHSGPVHARLGPDR